MKFTVTNDTFGPGRAGANHVGDAGDQVPVTINVEALQGYGDRENGIEFLVAHEAAHALKEMQKYNQQLYNEYAKGAGKDLTQAERIAQYPSTPQFKANEARTNTVARAILAHWNKPSIVPDPENDYQVC